MFHTPDCRGYARAFLVSNSFGKVVNRQARKKNRQCKSVKKFPSMFLKNSFLSNISSCLICNGSNFLLHSALVNGSLTVSKPVKSNLKKTRKKGKQHRKLLHWRGSVGSGNIREDSFCKSTVINSQSSFEEITKDEVSCQATSNNLLEDFFFTEKNDIEENNIHVTTLSDKIDISEKLAVSTDDLSQEEIGCNQAELDEYCTESKFAHADKTSEQAVSLSCSGNSVDNQDMSLNSSFRRSTTFVQDAVVVRETPDGTGSDTGVSSHLSTEKCSLHSYGESVVTFNNPDDLVSQCITTNSSKTYHKKSNNSQAFNTCFSEDPAFTCHIDDRALCSREACCSSTSIAFPTAKRGRRTRRISGNCNTRQNFGNVKTKTRKDINHPVWQRVQRRSSNDERLYKHMHSSSFSLQDDLVGEVTDSRLEQSASFEMGKYGDMELASNGSSSFKMAKHVVDTTKYSPKSSGKLVSKVSEKRKTKSILIPKQDLRKNLDDDDENSLAQVVNKNNDRAVGSISVPHTNSQTSDISPLERASSFPAKPWFKENLHTGSMTPTVNTSNMASNISTYSSQKDTNLLVKTFDCLDLECTDKENCEAIVAKVCKDLNHSLCHIADKKSKGKKLNDGSFHGEYAKQDNGSFPVSQKWVPVGKKEDLRSRLKGVSSESDGCFSHELDDEKGKSWCNPYYIRKGYISCNSQFTQEGGDHCTCIFETDLHKINLVVKEAHRLQVATESFQLANDIPLAAFERFLYAASPMLGQTSNIYINKYCYQEEWMGDTLCQHQIPNISLKNIWQWYENPGNYGLEVKVEDCLNPKEEGNNNYDFCAYFVPYLSAVQLFGQSATCICSNRSISDDKEKSFEVDKILNYSSQSTNLPISSLLLPHPCTKSVTQVVDSSCRVSPEGISCIKSIHKKCVSSQELLFEYFESEQPQLRRPLLEKIKELIKGNADLNSKMYGDPIMLECLNLHDLHPASWFSVAWYPIYQIPDGNFRAAFLTYHSLGLFTCRRTLMEFNDEVPDIVLPVVGLQSYNAKGECWFRQWKPHNEAIQTQGTSLLVPPDNLLEERLKTLLTTASVMSRASIYKGDKTSVNKQPDYEFFLSRGS